MPPPTLNYEEPQNAKSPSNPKPTGFAGYNHKKMAPTRKWGP